MEKEPAENKARGSEAVRSRLAVAAVKNQAIIRALLGSDLRELPAAVSRALW